MATASENLSKGSLVGSIQAAVAVIEQDYGTYDGEYEVTPSSEEQVLATAGCSLTDDITISSIPYYEVSNDYGGTTVTIG